MLKGIKTLLGTITALTLVLTSATLAHANSEFWGNGGGDTGSIGITNPGSGGGGNNNDVDGITDINFTPGPTTCTLNKGTQTGGDIHNSKNPKDNNINC